MILIETKQEVIISITTRSTEGTKILIAMALNYKNFLAAFEPKDPFIKIDGIGIIEVKSAIEFCDYLLKIDLGKLPRKMIVEPREYPHANHPT